MVEILEVSTFNTLRIQSPIFRINLLQCFQFVRFGHRFRSVNGWGEAAGKLFIHLHISAWRKTIPAGSSLLSCFVTEMASGLARAPSGRDLDEALSRATPLSSLPKTKTKQKQQDKRDTEHQQQQ